VTRQALGQAEEGGQMGEVVELADRYVEAWNGHDPAEVSAMFADGGTYEDPTTGGPVTGQAIAEAATQLFGAFPDVRFESQEVLHGERSAAIHWLMRGTNTGSFAGAPPTGATVALGCAQFLTTEDGLVTSVVGYLDQRSLAMQLGLQAPIMPRQVGPIRFGTSVRVEKGSRARPGAVSVTRLDMGSLEGLLRLRQYAGPVLAGMASMDPVVGAAILNDGERVGYTVSAWSSPDAATEIMRQDQHRAAMRAFFSDGLGVSGWTSVWVPARFNTLWVRCPACATMLDAEAGDRCACGASVPEPPPYF
jgi:steroid delta-isomerase-like uncharacterized protein